MSSTSSPATQTPSSPPPPAEDPTPTTPTPAGTDSPSPTATGQGEPNPTPGILGRVQATVAGLRTTPSRSWGLPGGAFAPGSPSAAPASGPDRTDTWATDDADGWPFDDQAAASGVGKRPARQRVDVRAVSACLSQIIQIVANAAGWVASRRGYELRPPTEEERAKVSDPAAALAARKLGVAFLTQDLIDVVQIGAGLAGYIETKPLARTYAGEPASQGDDPTDSAY